MSFIKTPEHLAIENAVQDGSNVLVSSGPGSGKTTCIAKLIIPIMLRNHRGDGAAIANNVANSKDLERSIANSRVTSKTVCALMWRVFQSAQPTAKVVVNTKKGKDFRGRMQAAKPDKMELLVDELFQKEIADGENFATAITLVSHAKKAAFGVPGHPDIDDRDAWKELAARHVSVEVEGNMSDDADSEISEFLDQQITYAIKLLLASNKDFLRVNFDDQLYLPILMNVKLPKFDFLVYDEFQDVKPIEVEFLRRIKAMGTQIVGVGDPMQYAYEFAGALYNAFEVVPQELNMTVLSMRTSWRCSVVAAELANGVFPDSVIPSPNAKQGEKRTMDYPTLFDSIDSLDSNHGLLSRTHKNLMPAALKLLAAKKPFWYKGVKDLVQRMESMLYHHSAKKEITNLAKVRESITEYQNECEIRHLSPAGNLPMWVQNQAECVDSLNLLLANCELAGEGLDCVKAYLKTLGESERKTLNGPALCTIHVSKGLEWSNVYVIGECRHPRAKTEQQIYAEKCLEFVAYSRSSENVTIVNLDKASPTE